MTYVGLKELVRQGGVTFSFTNRLEVQKESRELLLEAIEKQTPKKPAETKDDVTRLWCGNCHAYFGIWGDIRIPETSEYCFKCGQRIDWSD